jgi:GT2 family glycosyltransferase
VDLSIVIPAYNDLPGVLTCLNSLRAYAVHPNEYLVQDDASPDLLFPAVIPPEIASVQRNDQNVGFGINCNTGALRAHGDVLFFCNQDVYAPDNAAWSAGWDAHLLAAFEDPTVGIVGPRLLFPDGRIQSAGAQFDAKCQPVHRCLGYSNPHHEEVSTPREVSWTTGAALAIRRDLFMELGGFDAAYRAYFEDTDLCLRARAAGYKIMYWPKCTLIHRVGSTGGSPHFQASARTFFERWVKTDQVKADLHLVTERFW